MNPGSERSGTTHPAEFRFEATAFNSRMRQETGSYPEPPLVRDRLRGGKIAKYINYAPAHQQPVMTPNAAFQYLVRDEIEHVPLEKLANRVLATSVVPYPPGIPMLMPGESTGANDGPYLGYLRALWAWDKRFPGFGHDTHGVENRDGVYYVQCLQGLKRGARQHAK